MTTLPTLTCNVFTTVADTAITGSDPVLETISGSDTGDYVYDATNSTHTGSCYFSLAGLPANFQTMTTLSVQLQYGAAAALTSTWDNLVVAIYQSDGTTALTANATVASSITVTSPTNSSVINFTGVNTTANLAVWEAARVYMYWDVTKVKSGDTVEKRVYAAELTGTYVSYDNLGTPNDITSTGVVDQPTITQLHQLGTVTEISSTGVVDQPTITQLHQLGTVTEISSTSVVDNPALTRINALGTPNDITSTGVVDQPTITQLHNVAVTEISSASIVDQPTISQLHNIAATEITSTGVVDNPALTPINMLGNVTEISSTGVVDQPTITQLHNLAVTEISSQSVLGAVNFDYFVRARFGNGNAGQTGAVAAATTNQLKFITTP